MCQYMLVMSRERAAMCGATFCAARHSLAAFKALLRLPSLFPFHTTLRTTSRLEAATTTIPNALRSLLEAFLLPSDASRPKTLLVDALFTPQQWPALSPKTRRWS
jgi:hypothetical protein